MTNSNPPPPPPSTTTTTTTPVSTPTRQAKTKLPTLKGSFHSTILLLISPDLIPMIAHETLLCTHSLFFRAALSKTPNHTYIEGQTRTIRLIEESVSEIETLLSWLYTGSLPPLPLRPSPLNQTTNNETVTTNAHYSTLINLYFLADRFLIPLLKNDIIDGIIALEAESAYVPCADHVAMVFERFAGSPRNPLRRLLVDMHAYDVDPGFVRENAAAFSKGFLVDLVGVTMGFCDEEEDGGGGGGNGKGGTGGRRVRPWVRDVKGYYENLV